MIKQSVINTFNRIGLDYKSFENETENVKIQNRFGFGSCETTPLIAECVRKVYEISDQYEMGITKVNVSDFDRIRYFVLEKDQNAYYTCID